MKTENLDTFVESAYNELKRLAAYYLRFEREDHTLRPTDLVHEVYLRLQEQHCTASLDRIRFLSLASTLMRRVLINHAKYKARVKRGGGSFHLALDEAVLHNTVEFEDRRVDYLALESALARLFALDERQAAVVEMHFFGGIEFADIALLLGVSRSTVLRDWRLAKAWLYKQLHYGPA